MSPAELNLLMQMKKAGREGLEHSRQQKRGKEGLLSALLPAIDKPSLPPPSCSFPFLLSPTFISKSLPPPAPHDAVVRPDESFQLVYCLCHPLNGELGPLPRSAVPLPFLPTAPLGASFLRSLSVPRLSPRKRRTKILLPPSISILNRQRQFSRVEQRGRGKVE